MGQRSDTTRTVRGVSALGKTALTDDDQLLFTLGHFTDFPLLILGETGVGKTHLAKRIHEDSRRSAGPFVVADCGAMTESLFEAELFGHRKGAFTGAVQSNDGLVSLAEGGTLFLDEVGNLPLVSQAKLLRLLEAKTYRAVGDSRERTANVRVIAATNLAPIEAVRAGRMREDLYYRLAIVEPIRIRALRERSGAVSELAVEFLRARSALADTHAALTDEATAWLALQLWPGNVRQLKGALDVAFELARVRWMGEPNGGCHAVQLQDLIRAVGLRSIDDDEAAPAESGPVAVFVLEGDESRPAPNDPMHRDWVIAIMERAGRNQSRAALLAGVSRRTVVNWIEKYGLPRPRVEVPLAKQFQARAGGERRRG